MKSGGLNPAARGESGLARALSTAQFEDGGLISRTPYEQMLLVDRLALLRSAYFAAKQSLPDTIEDDWIQTVEELEDAIGRVRILVEQYRVKLAQDTQVRKQREAYLLQLAAEYAKTRRTDEKAMEVFEQLAQNPECDMRWLQTLAMIYVVRQEWGRMRALATKLEYRTKNK